MTPETITPSQRRTAPAHSKQTKLAAARRRRRKRRQRMLVMFLLTLAAAGAFLWAERQRRETATQLAETQARLEEINTSTQEQAAAEAQTVLEKVGRLFDLPTDPPPTVATIVNVEQLRQTSDFYAKAEDGDQLIITRDRAILYDPNRDIILDVVSIELPAEPAAEASPEAAAPDAAEPSPAATPPSERTP